MDDCGCCRFCSWLAVWLLCMRSFHIWFSINLFNNVHHLRLHELIRLFHYWIVNTTSTLPGDQTRPKAGSQPFQSRTLSHDLLLVQIGSGRSRQQNDAHCIFCCFQSLLEIHQPASASTSAAVSLAVFIVDDDDVEVVLLGFSLADWLLWLNDDRPIIINDEEVEGGYTRQRFAEERWGRSGYGTAKEEDVKKVVVCISFGIIKIMLRKESNDQFSQTHTFKCSSRSVDLWLNSESSGYDVHKISLNFYKKGSWWERLGKQRMLWIERPKRRWIKCRQITTEQQNHRRKEIICQEDPLQGFQKKMKRTFEFINDDMLAYLCIRFCPRYFILDDV